MTVPDRRRLTFSALNLTSVAAATSSLNAPISSFLIIRSSAWLYLAPGFSIVLAERLVFLVWASLALLIISYIVDAHLLAGDLLLALLGRFDVALFTCFVLAVGVFAQLNTALDLGDELCNGSLLGLFVDDGLPLVILINREGLDGHSTAPVRIEASDLGRDGRVGLRGRRLQKWDLLRLPHLLLLVLRRVNGQLLILVLHFRRMAPF